MADNRFIGKARALQRLRNLTPAVRTAAREGLDEQAAFLVEQIRPNVPKDKGDLAASLEWHRNPRGDKLGVVVTEGRAQDDGGTGRKARAVEFGRPDMAAQPHFFPTYRAHKRKMQNAVQRKVRAVIRRIWGGAGT